MDAKSRRLAVIMIAILIALAAAVRLIGISTSMTHVDDVGVASTILEARREFQDVTDLRTVLENPRLRQHNSAKFKLLRGADEMGLLDPMFGVLGVVRDVLAVPARWTYAPAQFLLTAPLLSEGNSYRQTLIAGRAPSVAFSIAAIASMALLAWQRRRPSEFAVPVAVTALMATSLEFFAFSTHMSNYALGVLASTGLLWLATVDPNSWRSWKPAVALGAALWGLTLLSYHALIAVPAVFATIALNRLIAEYPGPQTLASALRSSWFWRLIAAFGAFIALIAPTYLILMSSTQPITWNAGPAGQFAIATTALNPVSFVIENGWLVFSAMTTPVEWHHPARLPLTAVFVVLFVAGIVRLLGARSDKKRRALGLYVVLFCSITLLLACMGLTALSPTRHALILLPIFALGCAEGLAFVLTPLSTRLRITVSGAVLTLLVALWVTSMQVEVGRRRTAFDEASLANVVQALRPAAIVAYDHTYDLDLMPTLRNAAPLFNEQNLNFPWFANKLPQHQGPTLAISSSSPLTADRRLLILDAVQRSLPKDSPWQWCADARVVQADVRPSRSTLEVYPLAEGGANGYFAYILEACPAAGSDHVASKLQLPALRQTGGRESSR